MKIYFYLMLLFMTVSPFKMLAQKTPMVILPQEVYGNVKLNFSIPIDFDFEKLAKEYLSVFVGNELEEYDINAIQGRYSSENGYLVFTPYFPFEKGMSYVVKTKESVLDSSYSFQSFRVGKKEVVDKAKVLNIYPSATVLPENLLRFYLYFNTPMKKGQALKHVQLTDSAGNIDNHAFMEFKQELWSADSKRLTLLFDPGRIKRGVSTNMKLGPALLECKRYNLIISGDWEDVYGQELLVTTTKEFVVGKGYRQHIKIDELKITKPAINSSDTLSIHFDRIIDHALVQSMIKVKDENNMLIVGNWETSAEEKTVHFIPDYSWLSGTYKIEIDGNMEDVSGNNLNNLLDQKTSEKNSNVQQFVRSFKI